MENDDIIYHYTDSHGLKGILEDQTLWATHFRYLNDREELQLYKKMLLDALRKKQVSHNIDFDKFKEYIETVSGLVSDEKLQHLCDIFICSFCFHDSDNKDIGLLSQWRGYGKDGGYAIGFDYKFLNDMKEKEGKKYNFDFATLDSVTYWDGQNIPEEQKENVNFIFDSYINGRIDGYFAETSERYLRCLPHLKHSGFNEENECRLAFGFSPSTSREIKFRNDRGSLIPYIELFKKEDGDKCNLPIRKIIIGPSPDAYLREKAVELLRLKHKLIADVVISTIPFRGE